jgi:hypothetical protein
MEKAKNIFNEIMHKHDSTLNFQTSDFVHLNGSEMLNKLILNSEIGYILSLYTSSNFEVKELINVFGFHSIYYSSNNLYIYHIDAKNAIDCLDNVNGASLKSISFISHFKETINIEG